VTSHWTFASLASHFLTQTHESSWLRRDLDHASDRAFALELGKDGEPPLTKRLVAPDLRAKNLWVGACSTLLGKSFARTEEAEPEEAEPEEAEPELWLPQDQTQPAVMMDEPELEAEEAEPDEPRPELWLSQDRAQSEAAPHEPRPELWSPPDQLQQPATPKHRHEPEPEPRPERELEVLVLSVTLV
jgi:hypothetical protein